VTLKSIRERIERRLLQLREYYSGDEMELLFKLENFIRTSSFDNLVESVTNTPFTEKIDLLQSHSVK
jgi:hypothetical protein